MAQKRAKNCNSLSDDDDDEDDEGLEGLVTLYSTGPPKLCKKACSILWFNKGIVDGNKNTEIKCVYNVSLPLSLQRHQFMTMYLYMYMSGNKTTWFCILRQGWLAPCLARTSSRNLTWRVHPSPMANIFKVESCRDLVTPSLTQIIARVESGNELKPQLLYINLIAETLSSYDVTLEEN